MKIIYRIGKDCRIISGILAAVLLSSCAVSADTVSETEHVRSRTVPNDLIAYGTAGRKAIQRKHIAVYLKDPAGTAETESPESAVSQDKQVSSNTAEVSGTPAVGAEYPGNGTESETNPDQGSNALSQERENQPEQSHTHSWTDLTETVRHPEVTHTVHHDAVTEDRWVWDSEPWDEEEYISYNICNVCGFREGMDEDTLFDHIENEHDGHASYHYERVCTGTVHHDGRGHYETVTVQAAWDETITDEPAWDETVVTGQICTGCGEVK